MTCPFIRPPFPGLALPIAGTWGFDGDPDPGEWPHPHSEIFRYFNTHGVGHLMPDDPFVWDGEIDGLYWPWSSKRNFRIWMAAMFNLRSKLRQVPLWDRNIIAHSHGGNIVILLAASGFQINNLITVATPVRADMEEHARHALRFIAGRWYHLYAQGWSDKMQLLGSLLDRQVRIERRFLISNADKNVENIGIPGGVSHSRILYEPDLFDRAWLETGVISLLGGHA